MDSSLTEGQHTQRSCPAAANHEARTSRAAAGLLLAWYPAWRSERRSRRRGQRLEITAIHGAYVAASEYSGRLRYADVTYLVHRRRAVALMPR